MADTIGSAGDLLTMLGEYKLAISQYERFLKLQKTKLGADDPQIRKARLYLADCHEKLKSTGKED
ncbi:MAG: hypothetical protein IT343_07540 [Candidatus Melainabacteria bacterium]|nr:hypothetical protein [Candidatus Melainabacteria bacterium]